MPQRGLTFGVGPLVPVLFVFLSLHRDCFFLFTFFPPCLFRQIYSNISSCCLLWNEICATACSVDARRKTSSVKTAMMVTDMFSLRNDFISVLLSEDYSKSSFSVFLLNNFLTPPSIHLASLTGLGSCTRPLLMPLDCL